MNRSARLLAVVMVACMALLASPVFAPCDGVEFNKWISPDGEVWYRVFEGRRVWCPMETDVHWWMRITVSLPSSWGGPVDAMVWDRYGAEIEIDGYEPGDAIPVTHGTASYYTRGRSEKVFLTWNVGTLNPGETATLEIEISTDINPAGHQEYTTPSICGCPETWYELNSGAVLHFMYEGKQYSAYTPQLMVDVWE